MKILELEQGVIANGVIVVLPESLNTVANVAM